MKAERVIADLREKIKTMQQVITEGLKSGDAGVLDMQAIKKKARAKAGLNAD